MKVSAPSFMSSSAPPADAPPVPETPADPSAPPPPAEPPQPATWPQWFAAVDNALIVLALVFAFLMASFAARNTDIYRHLAGGQRLLAGTYSLGSDPFSYSGAGRPWVNQNWLFDLTVYAAYSADPTGAFAVVLKAFVYAATFGLLLGFRRPGQAGWPWAVMVLAAALACSGTAHLRPLAFGTFFFSLLLLLVFRGDWAAGRKRTLLLVGAVSWLWGGFDSFALLAPLLLLAVAAGGWVQAMLFAPVPPVAVSTDDGEPSPDPIPEPPPAPEPDVLFAPPPLKALLLAAAVALLGVLLNPTFLIGVAKSPAAAVAQLVPYELSFSDALADDPHLREQGFSLLTPDFWKPHLGYNFSSLGLAVLVLAGALGLAFGYGRLPAGWVALWFATLLLGFAHYRFAALFAVAAVPLVGGLLNALSARIALGTVADPKTKGLLAASRLGRIVCVPAFLLLAAATVPGWLYPVTSDAALARRVEWRIAGDESFVRGVEQLQRWRTSGDLPEDARGLNVQPEFGDYAAWFAPAEKVFVNSRYRFHAAELPNLANAREALLFPKPEGPRKSAAALADQYGTEYVALGRPFVLTNLGVVGGALRDLSPDWADVTALWHLDGRTAIIGRSNSPRAAALRATLAINPARLAFAPQTLLPDGPLQQPLNPDAGWLAKLLLPPPQPAAFRDDGATIQQLAVRTAGIEDEKNQIAGEFMTIAVGGWARLQNRTITDAEWAFPLLLHRIGRQAVHQTPDAPSAFAVLADAFLPSRLLPEFEPQDSARQRLCALARAAARTVPPEQATGGQRSESARLLGALFAAQVELGQLDYARETVKELRRCLTATEEADGPPPLGGEFWLVLRRAVEAFRPVFQQMTGEDLASGAGDFGFEDQAKKSGRNDPPTVAALMKKLEEATTRVVGRLNDEWDRQTRQLKPGQRAAAALQVGLPKTALAGLKDADKLSAESSGLKPIELALLLVNLELETGQLEQASEDLTALEAKLADAGDAVKAELAELKLRKLRRQGNYKEAVALLGAMTAARPFKLLGEADKTAAVFDPGEITLQLAAAVGPFGAVAKQHRASANLAQFQQTEMNPHPIGRAIPFRLALLSEARYYYQRGLLELFAGDLPEARANFAQVLAPQGVPIGPVAEYTLQAFQRFGVPPQVVAQSIPPVGQVVQYVRLIDKYKNTPAPGGAK